jgi:hypothetical protein
MGDTHSMAYSSITLVALDVEWMIEGHSGTTTAAGTAHAQFHAYPRQSAFVHRLPVSDKASFVTGQAMIVDGGRTTSEAR